MALPENLSGLGGAPSGRAEAMSGAVAPPMAAEEMRGSAPEAAPEEQEAYNNFVSMALVALFDETNLPAMLDAMNTEDPREGVGKVTGMLAERVAVEAQRAGDPIPMDVLIHGGAEIFANVIDLAQTAGIHDFQSDQKMMQGAFYRAFDEMQSRLAQAGVINEEEADAAVEEIRAAVEQGQDVMQMLGIDPAAVEPVDPAPGLALDPEDVPDEGGPMPEDEPAGLMPPADEEVEGEVDEEPLPAAGPRGLMQ